MLWHSAASNTSCSLSCDTDLLRFRAAGRRIPARRAQPREGQLGAAPAPTGRGAAQLRGSLSPRCIQPTNAIVRFRASPSNKNEADLPVSIPHTYLDGVNSSDQSGWGPFLEAWHGTSPRLMEIHGFSEFDERHNLC